MDGSIQQPLCRVPVNYFLLTNARGARKQGIFGHFNIFSNHGIVFCQTVYPHFFFLFSPQKCPKNTIWEFPNLGLSRIDTAALFEMTFYQIAFYCHSPWLVCSTFKGFLCFVYCVVQHSLLNKYCWPFSYNKALLFQKVGKRLKGL